MTVFGSSRRTWWTPSAADPCASPRLSSEQPYPPTGLCWAQHAWGRNKLCDVFPLPCVPNTWSHLSPLVVLRLLPCSLCLVLSPEAGAWTPKCWASVYSPLQPRFWPVTLPALSSRKWLLLRQVHVHSPPGGQQGHCPGGPCAARTRVLFSLSPSWPLRQGQGREVNRSVLTEML